MTLNDKTLYLRNHTKCRNPPLSPRAPVRAASRTKRPLTLYGMSFQGVHCATPWRSVAYAKNAHGLIRPIGTATGSGNVAKEARALT